MAFKQMENISNFLTACENFGIKKFDLFQTADLYDNTNMPQVLNGIYALGRKVRHFINYLNFNTKVWCVLPARFRKMTKVKNL